MIEIDGSAGGGQLVRSALTCAMLRGVGFTMTEIRGNRSDPGLKAQHLSAVKAASTVCDASVAGAEIGSTTLTFEPGAIRPHDLSIDIGTAGSVSLLFDTVLPLATAIDRPMTISATGGTDVEWAPPIDYLRFVKIPLLRRSNIHAAIELERRGFYPAGGGRARMTLFPSRPERIELIERGAIRSIAIHSVASWDLAENDVAERQGETAVDRLERSALPVGERSTTYARSASSGSAVLIAATYEKSSVGFDTLGARGKRAESVGRDAADALVEFDDGTAAVDSHLADQLLVPLAVAGGRIAVPSTTGHVRTSLNLLEAFGYSISRRGSADGTVIAAG